MELYREREKTRGEPDVVEVVEHENSLEWQSSTTSIDRQSSTASVDRQSGATSVDRQSSVEDEGSEHGGFNINTFWVQWKNPEKVRKAQSFDHDRSEPASEKSRSLTSTGTRSTSRHSEPTVGLLKQVAKRLSEPNLLRDRERSKSYQKIEKVSQVAPRLYQVIVLLSHSFYGSMQEGVMIP